MIPIPSGVRVWLAVGRTDMRRGMNGLALQVQEAMKRDPHAGDLYVFRGRRGNLVKILWHDGIGMSLYAKRLEHGRFIWPSPANGVVTISAAQLAYMLDGIDWRNPRHTFRPERAGEPGVFLASQRPGFMIRFPGMAPAFEDLPDDIDALKAALTAECDRAAGVEAELAVAKAKASDDQAVIAHQQLQIVKLTRALYGERSERTGRLLDQIEAAVGEIERSAR